MLTSYTDDDVAAIRAALLDFFDRSARPLPWRATRSPYAIWISEVMSQQTRVETVVPYYDRWMRSFPDVHALADAPADDVLKAWEGLGYYSRARNLQATARILRERYQGDLPRSAEELRSLPGIGEYTAGAIASIAFDARQPAIDGNVRRVLARLLDEPRPSAALLRDVAATLIPQDRPGDFNQALMELGATVCTPRAPACRRCPVAQQCAARAAGTQLERPVPGKRAPVPRFDLAVAVLRDDAGRLMVERRPAEGLLAGLWAFPAVECAAPDPSAAADIARRYAQPLRTPAVLGTIEHVFSHRRERYHCWLIDVTGSRTGADTRWLTDDDRSLPLPRAQQRIRRMASSMR